jgi:hypothetical protein
VGGEERTAGPVRRGRTAGLERSGRPREGLRLRLAGLRRERRPPRPFGGRTSTPRREAPRHHSDLDPQGLQPSPTAPLPERSPPDALRAGLCASGHPAMSKVRVPAGQLKRCRPLTGLPGRVRPPWFPLRIPAPDRHPHGPGLQARFAPANRAGCRQAAPRKPLIGNQPASIMSVPAHLARLRQKSASPLPRAG